MPPEIFRGAWNYGQQPSWGAARIDPRYLVTFRARNPQDSQWSEEKRALVNPTSFRESVAANYSLRPVLGLSHEVAQYVRTSTRKFSMDLWISYHIFLLKGMQEVTDRNPIDKMLDYRNWFTALLVPAGFGQAPPIMTMSWPYADLWFQGVVDSLDIDYERFDYRGAPMELSLSLSFLEIPSGLMTADKVRKRGLGYVNSRAIGPRRPKSVRGE